MHRLVRTHSYQSKMSMVPKGRNAERDQAMRGSTPPVLFLFVTTKSLTIQCIVTMHYLLIMTFLYRQEYKSLQFMPTNN